MNLSSLLSSVSGMWAWIVSRATMLIIGAVVVLAATGWGRAWWVSMHPSIKPFAVPVYEKVETIRDVEKIKKVYIPVKEIQVIEKERIVEVLKPMPPEIVNNPDIQIAAAGQTECHDEGSKITSVAAINTTTGQTDIITKISPPPFFAIPNAVEVGLAFGLDQSLGYKAILDGRWEVLRTGRVHWGVYGKVETTDTGAEAFVGPKIWGGF